METPMIPNGKKALFITVENIDGHCVDTAKDGRTLEYESEYHGDHSENWIIAKVNGIEVSRYNTKFIQEIGWEPETA
jgi:hypothetical protein